MIIIITIINELLSRPTKTGAGPDGDPPFADAC